MSFLIQMEKKPMKRPPKLCRNKKKNFAYVYLNRKQVYLGKWGTEETQSAYDHFLLNWAKSQNEPQQQQPKDPRVGFTVTEIAVAYVAEYKERPVKNRSDLKTFLRIANRIAVLFPQREADSFRIRDLEILRDSFQNEGFKRNGEEQKHSRTYLNKLISRTKTMFSWGVSKEMVSAETVARLKFLQPLRKGRTTAPEPRQRHIIPSEDYKAVLKFLPAYYKDIIEILNLTGMRPSEICNMKVSEIEKTKNVWIYRPSSHKTAYQGNNRIIPIGKKAQKFLKRHLSKRTEEEYVFTPARAMKSCWDAKRAKRKTPVQPSQRKRAEERKGKYVKYREQINPTTIGRVVSTACKKAIAAKKISQSWTPYDLRHTAITNVRTKYGAETAQHFAGHSNLDTQRIYDHSALDAASKVAEEIG